MSVPRWSEAEIGDQSGRLALVTGANRAIGLEAARALAAHGAHVVLGRLRRRAPPSADAIAAAKRCRCC